MALDHTFTRTLTISSTAADGLSSVVQISGGVPVALIMPSTWTAADITFQASPVGSTVFFDVAAFDGTILQSTSPVAGQWQHLDGNIFEGVDRLKVRSGTSTGLAQGATRTLSVVCVETVARGKRV